MINKILIRTSDRKTLHKDRRSLGMNGENLQEVLLFCLDEKIEGNGIVEVELPNGEKGMIEVSRTEEGYELPVKSSLLTQTGFVKFQLRILHDNVEIFKSEIIALEVKDSINATASIPEEYPSWVDVLENLKQDLEKSESERVLNENERISAEETRQENFTEMQETVSNAVSNIKDLTEEYNSNAGKETKKFNDNAVDQTKTFNDNSDSKLAEYNKNHTDKIKEYDDNAKAKLDAYNKNNTDKTNAYNDNTVLKEKAYNDNAADKVKEYNTNVEQKETELEKLAEKKINEYNQVSAELTAKVKQVQAENESLKSENKLIKEQIPSATASGNSMHIEDSSNLDFDWKINGNQYQATREGYQLLNLQSGMQNGITYYVDNEGYFCMSGVCTSDRITLNLNEIVLNGTYTFTNKSISGEGINCALKDNTSEYKNIFFTNNKNETKEVNTILKDLVCYLTNGATYNSKIKLMLVSGSQEKDIELYGASPSPDYPSKIEIVGSNINLLNNTLQSQTIKGLTVTVNDDKSVKIAGTATSNTNLVFDKHDGKLAAGTYTLKDCRTFIESTENQGWWMGGQTRTFTSEATLSNIGFFKYYSANTTVNETIYPKLEEGIVATSYSPYGMGSVEVDVVNKNIMPIVNLGTNWEYTERGIKSFGKNKGTDITKFYIKKGQTIKIGLKLLSQPTADTTFTWYVDNTTGIIPSFGRIQNLNLNQVYERSYTADKDCEIKSTRWGDEVSDTFEFQLWAEIDNLTDYIQHQSQTAIMPIQQELLENDYVADVEHHEWEKIIIDTSKLIEDVTNEEGKKRYKYGYDKNIKKSDITHNVAYSNMFKLLGEGQTYWNFKGFTIANNNIYIYDEGESLTEFISKIADKQLVFYAQLATPVDLPLTSEQKAIRKQKLYTYKNITNISLSDKLASIDVDYKKDLETEHNKLQSQIDEIKQLISTTETSALLLDNLQKDIEMEVE